MSVEFATGADPSDPLDRGRPGDDLPASPTYLELVRDAVAAQQARKARRVRLTDHTLPDWTVVCRVPDDQALFARVMRRVEDAKSRDKPSAMVDAMAKMLALHCERLEYRGHVLADDGDPLTFADPRYWATRGVSNAVDAVIATYGNTVALGRQYAALMDESGIADADRVIVEDDGPDPTTR